MPSSSRRVPGQARFLLRLPSTVRDAVTRSAQAAGLSVNEYCVRRLRTAGSPLPLHPDAQTVIEQAGALWGRRLIGLVLHGSFVRGEARDASDVDVLVVVDAALPLTRALYQQWDRAPATWDGRPVDSHFVHLPADPLQAGAVWCEAAIDGFVLLDATGRVDEALRRVRRAIAAGHLVRKQAHGHPYWTKVA